MRISIPACGEDVVNRHLPCFVTNRSTRCDIPAHVYQSTFSPNTQWSEQYAQGPEILAYWRSVARKYDVYSKIRFNTKVLGCFWNEGEAKWQIETEDLTKGSRSDERFDFVITAIGHFNDWKLPDCECTTSYHTNGVAADLGLCTRPWHRHVQGAYPPLFKLGSELRSAGQTHCYDRKWRFWSVFAAVIDYLELEPNSSKAFKSPLRFRRLPVMLTTTLAIGPG